VRATSSIYETDPVGYADQPRFWNLVVRVTTRLSPEELLQQLLEVERRMGRERSFRNAPRVIDLDILLFDDVVLEAPGLSLPHPRMNERAFVLYPLVELAPDLTDPVTGEYYRDLLRRGQFQTADIVPDFEENKP
jgi:2-amino-4-hydroxy-6-hydroxymethyldihydropteridine diphosphokinase